MNLDKILRIAWNALALMLCISGIITHNEMQSYTGAVISAILFISQERK